MEVVHLPVDLSSFVRASSNIPSYHSAVEEMILNSIDAKCTNIEILLCPKNFSFEVRDDGI